MTETTQMIDLAHLRPIELEELLTLPSLQTRRDRKYLVPLDTLADLAADVPQGMRILQHTDIRWFRYESTYFDTPEHASYLGAARRRPHRFKVRTRSYLDTKTTMLEVKVRDGRGFTVKHRCEYPTEHRHQLTDHARRYVAAIQPPGRVAAHLDPALVTTYRRCTLLLGEAAARVTIDTNLTWRIPHGSSTELDGFVLVETKTPGAPCEVDHILWHHGIRPIRISKYCTGLAALKPELPANKWHRVLSHHFGRRGAAAIDHPGDQT